MLQLQDIASIWLLQHLLQVSFVNSINTIKGQGLYFCRTGQEIMVFCWTDWTDSHVQLFPRGGTHVSHVTDQFVALSSAVYCRTQ